MRWKNRDRKRRHKEKKPKKLKGKMAIDFIPFEELFRHDYQLTYIDSVGNIYVGPYVYNVFKSYTTRERQQAFQVCKKHLSWENSGVQSEWELCMYMYQWIVKGPPPFPHSQYTLSGAIQMANWHVLKQSLDEKQVSLVFHYITPSGTNVAGLTYSECILRDKAPEGSSVPKLETDNPTEYAAILDGSVYEEGLSISLDPNATNPEKVSFINGAWERRNSKFQSFVTKIYKFYGYVTP